MLQCSPETSWLVASYVWSMKCSMLGTARVTVIRSCWKACQIRTHRIKLAHDHVSAPKIEYEQGDQSAHVEQQQADEVAVLEPQIRCRTDREHGPHGRAVGMHHALPQARGAGGVHDVQEVVVLGQDLRLPCGRCTVEILVVHREGGSIGWPPHVDPSADRCALAPAGVQVGHDRAELAPEDQRLGAAVSEHEHQLVSAQPPVEGYKHGTNLGGAEEGLDELGAVHQESGHPVALPDAEAGQHMRPTVRLAVELDIRAPLARRHVDEGFQARVEFCTLGKKLREVVLHAISLTQAAERKRIGSVMG